MATGTKLSRQQLKAIVKECLVEILQEGLGGLSSGGSSINLPVTESRRPTTNQQGRSQPRQSPLDVPIGRRDEADRRHSASMIEAIKAEARGNSVMADILADTAMTTLPKMMSNGDGGATPSRASGKSSLQEQFNGSPEDVFGEDVASKWANLAFADVKPRN